MTNTTSSLTHLSDGQLLAEIKRLAQCERQATAHLVASLAELDARRLYLGEGCSSLFTYCTHGRLRVGTVSYDNAVDLPFDASDSIEVRLQLSTSGVVELGGSAVRIEPIGEARYVEDLTDDFRPRHGS